MRRGSYAAWTRAQSVRPSLSLAVLSMCLAFLAASVAHADPVGLAAPLKKFFTGGREYKPRGPIEIREDWVLSQMRLTLPPATPDMLAPGQVELYVGTNRGSDFGWNQTTRGENPRLRRYLVDAEHQTIEARFDRGISKRWGVGLRMPVHFRGAGFMDAPIDVFHGITALAGNLRDSFDNHQFRIEGRLDDGTRFSWNDSRGWGLGNIELNVKYALVLPKCRPDWRVSAIGRVQLPTATGPFRTDSLDVGAQVVAAKQLVNRVDFYCGVGGTWFSERTIRQIKYASVRANAFIAFEWQIGDKWSIIVDSTFTTRLIDNILKYQAVQWYWDMSAKYDLSRNTQLEFGVIENITNQQTTTDVGFFIGMRWRW